MLTTKIQASVIVIDDDIHVIKSFEDLLSSDKRITLISTLNDPKAALQLIIDKKPDLVILDIQMPAMSGFEIVRELHELNIRPGIIFITAFDEYAIEAIKLSAFDFLLKPVDPGELMKSLERFFFTMQQKAFESNYVNLINYLNVKKIRFNNSGGFIMINPHDILYIKADWNYSEIFFEAGKKELVVMNLGMIEKLLPSGTFARINRSTIINLQYLERVNRGKRQCILRKGDETFSFSIPLRRIRELESLV